MALTLIIAGLTASLMIFSVLIKPYIKVGPFKVGLYCIICVIGALFMLIFRRVSLNEFYCGITADTAVNPLKILVLFLSMSLISIYLGEAGFFDIVANKIFEKKTSAVKLFIILYFVVAILTVFTSNDIIILTFTPPICIFCKKAKISPIPFLIGEFVSANTWSMTLIVGNPTNVYLAGSFGISFFDYFTAMVLPSLLAGIIGFFTLLIIFYKTLTTPLKEEKENIEENLAVKPVNFIPMLLSLIALLLCIIFLAISDIIGVEMWFVCFIFAVILTISIGIYSFIKNKNGSVILSSIKKAPYELIPFILSMFIIVLSLDKNGITEKLSNLLIKENKTDALTFGFVSAISSNLLNNIPMSVLFEKIVNSKSIYALYGTVIGSNIGAFITPVGALAGIMWSKILKEYNVKLSFFKFSLYGSIVAIFSLLFSTLALVFI